MAKKKQNKEAAKNSRSFNEKDVNPFSSIVLKEKKEVKPSGKKPSQIVQGYDPNASFKDILYNWEHHGVPYAMPHESKKRVEEKSSFKDIFDSWERLQNKSEKRGEYKRVSEKYTPSSSFQDILDEFEGKKELKKEKEKVVKEDPQVNHQEKKKEEEEIVKKPTFFKEMEEDDERGAEVTWSIFGNNKKVERKKEDEKVPEIIKKEKRDEKRSTYVASIDFKDILDEYDKKSKRPKSYEKDVKNLKDEIVQKHSFFKKADDSTSRSEEATWSIYGDNKSVKRENKPQVKESNLFKESVNKLEEKSFDEILKEKGEFKKSKVKTLNELRVMLPQATLDLHGNKFVEAEALINTFLDESLASKLDKVAIIHGKGLHSADGVGVLKDLVLRIIKEREIAREITVPKLQYGGTGALWIILKK